MWFYLFTSQIASMQVNLRGPKIHFVLRSMPPVQILPPSIPNNILYTFHPKLKILTVWPYAAKLLLLSSCHELCWLVAGKDLDFKSCSPRMGSPKVTSTKEVLGSYPRVRRWSVFSWDTAYSILLVFLLISYTQRTTTVSKNYVNLNQMT